MKFEPCVGRYGANVNEKCRIEWMIQFDPNLLKLSMADENSLAMLSMFKASSWEKICGVVLNRADVSWCWPSGVVLVKLMSIVAYHLTVVCSFVASLRR